MKHLFLTIVLAVSNYTVPVDEIATRLSVIAPTRIELVDLANPQPVDKFRNLHYAIVKMKTRRQKTIFLHAPYIGGLSGGKANSVTGIADVAIVEGYDERNLQVILHEIGHLLGMKHNAEPCNVMNVQPCGLSFLTSDIKRARRI